MSEVFARANSTRMIRMIVDIEIYGLEERINNADLLPNPNAMSIESLTELSSFPFRKKRLGLNSSGSG
jgi:hypothetical protein